MIQVKRKKKEITVGPYTINLWRTEVHTPDKKKVTKTREVKKKR